MKNPIARICSRRVTWAVTCFLGVLALTPGAALALPLIDQPYLDNGDNGSFAEFDGQQIADNFTITPSVTVARIRWFGVGILVDPYTDGQVVPFQIRFFDDNGSGAPQFTPFSDVAVSAVAKLTGLTASADGRKVYQFDATLAVSAGGGTQQWISILENEPTTAVSTYRWANSSSSPGDVSCSRPAGFMNWTCTSGAQRRNQAFALRAPVPPNCGDGIVQADEQCDDGAANGTAGDCCEADCSFNDGASCDDGDLCTTGDVCSAGACAGPAPLDCNDADACTADSCDSLAGCEYAKTGRFFGNDDSGCLPPDKPTAKCEDGVAKATSSLAKAILGCHIKTASAFVKPGPLFDDDCESAPGTGKGALDKFDKAVAKLAPKCGGCAIANAPVLRTLTEEFLDQHNGDIYCAGVIPFFDEDTGFFVPDKPTGKCEDGVARAIGTYAAGLVTCHLKTADAGAKGVTLDDDACESNPVSGKGAKEKFDAAIAKLAKKCGGCAIANAPALRAAVEQFLEDNNKQMYCAG